MRRIPYTVPLFEKLLADEHVAGVPSAVEKWYVRMREGNSKGTLQNSVAGTTSVKSSLPLIVRNLTG